MITQKDVHNQIVENASVLEKQCFALQCDGDPKKMKQVEQGIADFLNGFVKAMKNCGIGYLNQKIK